MAVIQNHTVRFPLEFGIHLGRFIRHVKEKYLLNELEKATKQKETRPSSDLKHVRICSIFFFFPQHVLFSLMGVSHTLSKGTGNSVFCYSLKARPNI